MNETIAAIATPPGAGAIALLRLSGPEAVVLADRVFVGKVMVGEVSPRRLIRGQIIDEEGQPLDEVLVAVYRAPNSYTGEDVVEISCHGGVLVTQRLLELLLRHGARMAEAGEFTQRAFLHGKLELTQAEAVMDLINAQTDLALRAAHEQLAGRLGEETRELQAELLGVLAHVEAFIDFPDEDIAPETGAELLVQLAAARARMQRLLATASRGRVLREGVRTVIYGAPNVGKSSLLNLLLGRDRAIVSEFPGTTRDTIEELIDVQGIPVRLVDTAGVRVSADPVEQAGIARTAASLEAADLVLQLMAADEPGDAWPDARDERALLVLNKCDLGEHPAWQGREAVRISCRDGSGIDALEAAIFARVMTRDPGGPEWTVAINARHQRCLAAADQFCAAAETALRSAVSPEFVAIELRAALEEVGAVVGQTDAEDLLGRIFSTFCIGK